MTQYIYLVKPVHWWHNISTCNLFYFVKLYWLQLSYISNEIRLLLGNLDARWAKTLYFNMQSTE